MTFYLHAPDGTITQTINAADEEGYRSFLQGLGGLFAEGPMIDGMPQHYYVNNSGEVVVRQDLLTVANPSSAAADGVAEISLSPMVSGTVIRADGQSYLCDGSDLVLTSIEPKTYVIELDPPVPYKPKTVIVEFV